MRGFASARAIVSWLLFPWMVIHRAWQTAFSSSWMHSQRKEHVMSAPLLIPFITTLKRYWVLHLNSLTAWTVFHLCSPPNQCRKWDSVILLQWVFYPQFTYSRRSNNLNGSMLSSKLMIVHCLPFNLCWPHSHQTILRKFIHWGNSVKRARLLFVPLTSFLTQRVVLYVSTHN